MKMWNKLKKWIELNPVKEEKENMDALFLDFDGVLHPVSGIGRMFSRGELLLPLFRKRKDLGIVISSDWRFGYDLEEMKRKLGVLGEYVIGQTPQIVDLSYRYFPGDDGVLFSRQREILWYLKSHPYIRNWVAVDDIPDLFEDEFREQHVVITDCRKGITEEDVEKLDKQLDGTPI